MATAEERIDKLESKFPTLEQQVSTIAAKVDIFIEESRQQSEDLRCAQEKHDADMKNGTGKARRGHERDSRGNTRRAQEHSRLDNRVNGRHCGDSVWSFGLFMDYGKEHGTAADNASRAAKLIVAIKKVPFQSRKGFFLQKLGK